MSMFMDVAALQRPASRRPGWIRVLASGLAQRLSDMCDAGENIEQPRHPSQRDDAMIAAARSTFANVDILVGKTGIRYIARPVANM